MHVRLVRRPIVTLAASLGERLRTVEDGGE
jgi:hypothetical protein